MNSSKRFRFSVRKFHLLATECRADGDPCLKKARKDPPRLRSIETFGQPGNEGARGRIGHG